MANGTIFQSSYEVIIIGAGPAAWSAAIFLARANVKTLVIGDPAASGLSDAAEVWNYAGLTKGISGRELLENMQEQAVSQGAVFLNSEVTHVEKVTKEHSNILQNVGMFLVRTAERKEFFAKKLLLAHGANYIKVNLPGEKELVGKGVHYCALCDGPLYKGKEVIVLGNGNLAAEEAVQLVGMGAKVKIITHAAEPNFSKPYEELLNKNNISVLIGKAVRFDPLRAEKIEPGITVFIKKKDGEAQEKASAVFIALGVASSHVFAQKLGLAMAGNFLKVDANGRTNVEGVWAAGLARGGVNQAAKSAGEGATAAVDIIKVLKGLPQYIDHT